MLTDRPTPAALRLRQRSWASRRAGRLGIAGKQVQALGPPPPRPGCGVGPRPAEVPTAQLLHSQMLQAQAALLSRRGWRGAPAAWVKTASGPGPPYRHTPLTFSLHLDSCQWSCSQAQIYMGEESQGLTISGPSSIRQRLVFLGQPRTKDWSGPIYKCCLI